MVTIEGTIIEQSGLMSGGGAPKKGLMGNLQKEEASQEQLNQLQIQIQNLEEEANQNKRDRV